MKKIFTKRFVRTTIIIGVTGIALVLFGITAYASVPSFQKFVNSSFGIEKKNVSISSDTDNKTVAEENNAGDTSPNTVAIEKPTENVVTDTAVTAEKTPVTTSPPKTKVTTPTPTPAPAPTPAPDPAPTQVAFQVSSVTASVSPTQGPSSCNHQTSFLFTFTGTITATAAGTVQYKWEQDDGGGSSDTLTFSSAGSQQVTTDRTIYGSTMYPGWNKIVVTSPNSISSNKASFTRLYCPI